MARKRTNPDFERIVAEVGWEMRERGGPYYHHYVKGRDGRTVRRYVGGGPVATLAAQFDEIKRLERELENLRLQEERQRLERSVGFLSGLEEAVQTLVEAHLLAAGLTKRRGEWRRPRESDYRSAGVVAGRKGQAEGA